MSILVEEMAPWAKFLLCKYKDPGLDVQNLCKSWTWWLVPVSPVLGGGEVLRAQWLASLAETMNLFQ